MYRILSRGIPANFNRMARINRSLRREKKRGWKRAALILLALLIALPPASQSFTDGNDAWDLSATAGDTLACFISQNHRNWGETDATFAIAGAAWNPADLLGEYRLKHHRLR
jgi:hypothetical protein